MTQNRLPAGPPGRPARVRDRVRRLLTDSGYSLLALPLVLAASLPVFVLVSAGTALLWLLIGLPLLVAAGCVARGLARLERWRIRTQLGEPAPAPVYVRPDPAEPWYRRLLTPLRDQQVWLDALWVLIGLVTGLFASVLTLTAWAVALGGTGYPLWQRWLPDGAQTLFGLPHDDAVTILLTTLAGVLVLCLLPLLARTAARAHSAPALMLLSGRAHLQDEVLRATGGRDAAREAEASALRRLERDIHDGPQQRLVRLSMDLGRAREAMDHDPDRARAALDAAYEQARDTVEELRALSRGIAPPLLVDRGLGPAIEELLTRSEVPVDRRLDDDAVRGLAPHVETAVYFVVAEALTNVAKHSRADRVEVVVDRAVDADRVLVRVTDDGVGGAHPGKGSGLAGLRTRVLGLGGTLELTSPPGGPTVLRVEVPVVG